MVFDILDSATTQHMAGAKARTRAVVSIPKLTVTLERLFPFHTVRPMLNSGHTKLTVATCFQAPARASVVSVLSDHGVESSPLVV